MKTTKILSFLLMSIFLFSFDGQAQESIVKAQSVDQKIEVINFHSTRRCMTCNAIEANTKYTLETYFAAELKSGVITQQTVNVELEENEKMAEKFQVTGTSLYLNVIKGGEEKQIDLSNFAFTKGKDKEAFSKDLAKKISKLLDK